MIDYELLGVFYLGKLLNSNTTDEPLLYDSRDMLAHTVCLGDDSSGKTGLGICLIEEAAIDNIPVIAIDTKGDLSSLLLRFDNLSGESFLPWVDADEARRAGLSPQELAKQEANKWHDALLNSAQNADRIKRLSACAEFSYYTPGSSLGIPLAILNTFRCPPAEIIEDSDLLKEQIRNAVTNTLLFAGLTVEQKSKEHILLSAIVESCWKQSRDISLIELVGQIENPPVQRFGALDLETFFPVAYRHEFAMVLNSSLASPEFETWTQGEPISIDKLLYNSNGKNKVSIISIAHLQETEQMFVVSMLLTELTSWMRRQSGTSSLRAMLYVDDCGRFLPVASAPPSKAHLALLLHEARRVGLGLTLVCKNFRDFEFGALAEVGTWFVGKLGNESERQRALELIFNSTRGEANFDRKQLGLGLSQIPQQVFLIHNVLHNSAPILFKPRCTLSYLRPGLSRAQLKSLRTTLADRKPKQELDQANDAETNANAANISPETANVNSSVGDKLSDQNKKLGSDVIQRYACVGRSGPEDARLVYRPMLFASAQLRFIDGLLKLDCTKTLNYLFLIKPEDVPIRWEKALSASFASDSLKKQADPNVELPSLPECAAEVSNYKTWKTEFQSWLLENQTLQIYRCPNFGITSSPHETEGEFRARLQHASREKRDGLVAALSETYSAKQKELDYKLAYAERILNIEVGQSEALSEKAKKEQQNLGNSIFQTFVGRKMPTKMMSAEDQAKANSNIERVGDSQEEILRHQEYADKVRDQVSALQYEFQNQLNELKSKLDADALSIVSIDVSPLPDSYKLLAFCLCWAPCFRQIDGKVTAAW